MTHNGCNYSVAELAMVAHRQGFSGLDQIEQFVLEPGGTFAITAKMSGTRVELSDLMERMAVLHKQLEDLRRDLKL